MLAEYAVVEFQSPHCLIRVIVAVVSSLPDSHGRRAFETKIRDRQWTVVRLGQLARPAVGVESCAMVVTSLGAEVRLGPGDADLGRVPENGFGQ